MIHPYRFIVIIIILAGLIVGQAAAQPKERTAPLVGVRQQPPQVHALTEARIIIEPGKVIDSGVIVIRDGRVVAVGVDVQPPADARIWPMKGKMIYPGLIDAYTEVDIDLQAVAQDGPRYWNGNIRPEVRAHEHLDNDSALNKTLRSQGVTARLAAPKRGLIKGSGAVVTTADEPTMDTLVRDVATLHVRLTPYGADGPGGYPNSPMGAVSLVRQALYDAKWHQAAWSAWRKNPTTSAPEQSISLDQLAIDLDGPLPLTIDANSHLDALRAHQLGTEFELDVIIRGGGREYRRLDAIAATGRAVIVPLDFPKAPSVATTENAANVNLAAMMHWDIAPENPARLAAINIPIALTSDGLEKKSQFLDAVRKAVKRGLSPEAALTALTVTPAKLYDVSDQLGSLTVGKRACLVVTDGDLFDNQTRVLETWVDGVRYEIKDQPKLDVRGRWELDIDERDEPIIIEIKGKPDRLKGAVELKDNEPVAGLAQEQAQEKQEEKKKENGPRSIKLEKLKLAEHLLTAQIKADKLGHNGVALLSLTLAVDPKTKALLSHGQVHWPNGERRSVTARRIETTADGDDDDDAKEDDNESDDEDEDKDDDKNDDNDENKEKDKDKDKAVKPALYAVNYPLGAFGRTEPPAQPESVLFSHATIWTCAEAGVIEDGWVLVERGKIKAIGSGDAPEAQQTIDATGMHLSPGMIDCHSHIATDGGVNESGQAVTAEVRIGDFIDSTDISMYRQLAGGTTSANILHGSANPIGGQNQVIKFRWGALPEAMKFTQAPQGIKFALGENVKRSNSRSPSSRYPQSRMGVEQIIRDRFQAAGEYAQRWRQWRENQAAAPPRRDLELDALVEIIAGKRLIHCHAYRQDEMLALMRTCEDFGVRIATFQHVLEGYKIADHIARHGAMASSFSDWWAYKFEVYDAIPYNGALMHNAGVVVSYNSDDAELGRRLNLEAAKAVKYGGVDPHEAIKFLTLNPARQLRIDEWVGSIEPGKDADLVLWSASPLSAYSRCEQTWIDGRRYFDRGEHEQWRQEIREKRAALIQRILDSGESMADPEGDEPEEDEHGVLRFDPFCACRQHDHQEDQ